MNVSQQPFTPSAKGTVSISVTASSNNVQYQATEDANSCVRLYNSSSTVIIFVEIDSSPVVATTTNSMPIPPGGVAIIGGPYQYIAAIGSAAGPSVLYITPGNGVS